MTAAEAIAMRQSDPEWVRQNAEREAKRKALEAEFARLEKPLLADLAGVGYQVDSVWDLVNSKDSYPNAIPVLSKHLTLPYHARIRQGITRALTVPESRGVAGKVLFDELVSQKDVVGSEERWALANALTVAADKSMVSNIKSLLDDPAYSDVHERLRTTLKNLRA